MSFAVLLMAIATQLIVKAAPQRRIAWRDALTWRRERLPFPCRVRRRGQDR